MKKSTSRDSSWTHFQTFLHISQQLCKRLGNAMKKRNAPEILFLGQNVLKHDYPVSTFKAWYLYSRASFLSPLVPYGVVIFEIKTCEVLLGQLGYHRTRGLQLWLWINLCRVTGRQSGLPSAPGGGVSHDVFRTVLANPRSTSASEPGEIPERPGPPRKARER